MTAAATYTPRQITEMLMEAAQLSSRLPREEVRARRAAAAASLSEEDREVVARYMEQVVAITERHAERAEARRAELAR